MADSIKLADVLVGIKLDTAGYKRQLASLSQSTPTIQANNKQVIAGLQRELILKRAAMRLDQQRMKMLSGLSKVSTMGAVGAVGAIGGGLGAFLQSTDPAARKLLTSINRLKISTWQLMGNIGKVANSKFGLTDKIEKLSKFIQNITKEDIGKFLDTAKLTFFITGMAKIFTTITNIVKIFEGIKVATMASNIAKGATGNGVGTGVGTALAAGAGAGIGVNKKLLSGINTLGINMQKTAKEIGKVPTALKMALPFGMALEKIHGGIGRKLQGIGSRNSSSIIPSLPLLSKKPVVGGIGNIGATILAVAGLGMAFRALGKDGLEPAAKLASGLTKTLAFLGNVFYSVIEVLGTFTDILGSWIGSLVMVIKDIMARNWSDVLEDLKGFDNPFKNINEMKKNLDKIWTDGAFGKQDTLSKKGTSEKVGFADLNNAFQKMFEENYTKILADETKSNTVATQENTDAMVGLVATLKAASEGKSEWGNMEVRDGVWQQKSVFCGTAMMGSSLNNGR